MKISAVLTKKTNIDKESYPYIGTNSQAENGLPIVLFTGNNFGVCLVPNGGVYKFGVFHGEWVEKNFVPFYGELTLFTEKSL